ncbi:MAG TPA: beta-galactosidase, partial [Blastocatellia bacterium]
MEISKIRLNERPLVVALLTVVSLAALAAGFRKQPTKTLVAFDARTQPSDQPRPFPQFTGRSPDGHEIAANSDYLSLDGKPWLPVMGEFHYSRYPAAFWEDELLKMKAGGVQIVATYIFWIHHEEVEGKFDWSGQRNLRQFVEL